MVGTGHTDAICCTVQWARDHMAWAQPTNETNRMRTRMCYAADTPGSGGGREHTTDGALYKLHLAGCTTTCSKSAALRGQSQRQEHTTCVTLGSTWGWERTYLCSLLALLESLLLLSCACLGEFISVVARLPSFGIIVVLVQETVTRYHMHQSRTKRHTRNRCCQQLTQDVTDFVPC